MLLFSNYTKCILFSPLKNENVCLATLKQVVSQLIWQRLLELQSVRFIDLLKKSKEHVTLKDRPRSGRPRVTDLQTDTQIVGKFRDHPFKTDRSAAMEASVSERTVVRRLAMQV